MPRYSKLALLWLILGILYYVFWVDIEGGIFIFVECITWIYGGAGIILLIFIIGEIWLQTKLRHFPKNSVTAITVIMICGMSLLYLGPHYGFLVRFYLFKPHYEEIARRLSQNYPIDQTDTFYYDEKSFSIVDKGPPIRVAIELPGGLLDNFQAVVYDPSGIVGQLQRFNLDTHWDDPQLNDLKKLFGGEMFYCEPIEGSWFYCWFT
jgi:hypothetical protein